MVRHVIILVPCRAGHEQQCFQASASYSSMVYSMLLRQWVDFGVFILQLKSTSSFPLFNKLPNFVSLMFLRVNVSFSAKTFVRRMCYRKRGYSGVVPCGQPILASCWKIS